MSDCSAIRASIRAAICWRSSSVRPSLGILLRISALMRSIACSCPCASPKFCPALKSTACTHSSAAVSAMTVLMFRHVGLWLGLFTRCLQSHRRLLLENLALRQQLAVLKRKHPRPRMGAVDKIFWVFACRFWGAWKQSLVLVNPETVVGWHRAGFRLYWSLISKARKQVGRKKLSSEVRELILRMTAENPTCGAPRIHGELLMLGFAVSERTISRWMKRVPRDPPAQRWRVFLAHHREAIAAMDFFTVPTIRFGVLYCFFVISHDCRRILHFNITTHPTSSWIIQQLR